MPILNVVLLASCLSTANIANFQFIFATDSNIPSPFTVPFTLVVASTQVSAADLSKVQSFNAAVVDLAWIIECFLLPVA